MSEILTTACNWPILVCPGEDPCDGCPELDSLDPGTRELIEQAAVEHLWRWTGKQFGCCDIALRPCRKDCCDECEDGGRFSRNGGVSVGPWTPALIGGLWHNLRCGDCGDDCSCSTVSEVVLPGPVCEVTQVMLDGAVMDPSRYRVDNHRRLVRTDGEEWPTCQEMALPPSEPGTWEVMYRKGIPVPAGGQFAAGALACELAKAFCGSDGCRLPQRVQSITRQGVSMAFLDDLGDVWTRGATGIFSVDSWIASVTQPRRMMGSRVFSPDRPRPRRTTSNG